MAVAEEKDWRFGFFFFFPCCGLVVVLMVAVVVVVAVADSKGGCGWFCGFFLVLRYIILL